MATEQQARALYAPSLSTRHATPATGLLVTELARAPADRRIRDGREANDRAKQAAPQGRDLDHHPFLVYTAAQEDNALLWAS